MSEEFLVLLFFVSGWLIGLALVVAVSWVVLVGWPAFKQRKEQ